MEKLHGSSRQKQMLAEIDNRGYFNRQSNQLSQGFGPGELPVEPGRYRLAWAKICQWSNRAAIVLDLLGLTDCISKTLVEKLKGQKELGWQFTGNQEGVDPVLGIRYLNDAYSKASTDYTLRPTVPALIDSNTGKVVNNDFHHLTLYFERDFKKYQSEYAPDLYPKADREIIDQLNDWLFHNVNNAVYRATFARSKRAYWQAYYGFYAGMDRLEERLSKQRFLLGDYVTDSDVRLYTTLTRLDIRYAYQLGPTKKRLVDYPNLWNYARELYQIPAFSTNTFFEEIMLPSETEEAEPYLSFNSRFAKQIDFDSIWRAGQSRDYLSSDPDNVYKKGRLIDG
ncbi:glutathione S-transferase C-terminal domain-containing protein [Aerococcus sp. UMB10185]|uniref:glutathione S-transferase C-terminal domain-containing protein n=1 Tax=unclassified Aerococcus TaxID=2618060 RepID=UPI0008A5C268|nr:MULTISPECIES: glutathione S-transferase C-terminal domain-containing protein [unclassified Aerococcus]KAB0647343.1 glutathione S-transferase [Aerococcus sanguinicola]MDK6233193.1 glutathione S-transferase C-terminal domain-containing protein [Aerococcus sp. UMB10185]MDK6856030.1 glutathione S-transferase C-terminal domain-containing protein [Aerococcus sp. UMB7533]MDK8502375.1 glutathione S-transferase C-terminal domain-containing protein [Aerococcus sp. UMB1112A]OFN00291.1 glutathione S-tr